MATQLFLLDTAPDTHLGTDSTTLVGSNFGWTSRALGTSRGSGVVASDATATTTGPVAGIEIQLGTVRAQWISPPVSADVTISGTITANIWAAESNMSANVAINVVIEILRANTTTTRNSNTIQSLVTSTFVTELAVTTRAVNNFTTGMTSGSYTSQTLNRGDRLRIRVFGDDSTANMASGFTFNIGYNGSSAAADGDSYVTFTENFSFESAPSGTQLFLTNTSLASFGASSVLSSFTGSNENPLSEGGNWAKLNSSVATSLQRTSNQVDATGGTAAVPEQCAASYWTPTNFGADCEVYVTLSTHDTVNGTSACVGARIQGEGGADTWDGYVVGYESTTDILAVYRVTNATSVSLASTTISLAAGDKIGISCIGSEISTWYYTSGAWNKGVSETDTTYPSAGKVALFSGEPTWKLDDFGAGNYSGFAASDREAWTSRGAGVVNDVTNTAAGWTAPIQVTDVAGGATVEWFTKRLNAFTLTGMAQANIRGLESDTNANATLRCQIAVVDSDGANPTVWSDWCMAPITTDQGELGTSEAARTVNVSGDDLSVTDGQRLRIRIYTDDISSTAMGNAFNTQVFYNGTSAAASGDSYVTLAQSVTEFVASAASDETGLINERRTPRRRSMQRW